MAFRIRKKGDVVKNKLDKQGVKKITKHSAQTTKLKCCERQRLRWMEIDEVVQRFFIRSLSASSKAFDLHMPNIYLYMFDILFIAVYISFVDLCLRNVILWQLSLCGFQYLECTEFIRNVFCICKDTSCMRVLRMYT